MNNSAQSSKQRVDFNITINEKLIDMTSDFTLQQSFEKLTSTDFWYSIKEEYPKLSEEAINLILPFLKYICESPGFFHILQTNQRFSTD